MLVNTSVFGRIDVEQENIIHLPEGLYGFERKSDYALITKQDDDVTLMWLQSVDSDATCFVVFDPFDIMIGYNPIVENSDLQFLGCKDISDLRFLVIAVVPEDIANITVNLKSPIIINKKDNRARQVILANQNYPIKFPLFSEENIIELSEIAEQ